MEERVILNVGGTRFMTYRSTLSNLPGTHLANLDELDACFDVGRGEYFFDRNPAMFEYILDFYRTGQLHFPHCYCGPNIKKELEFWGLNKNSIHPCCWKAYSAFEDEKHTIDELSKTLGEKGTSALSTDPGPLCMGSVRASQRLDSDAVGEGSWLSRMRVKLWRFLEKPQSSVGAQIWAVVIFFLILTSIAVVVMETHPTFRVPKFNINITQANSTTNTKLYMYATTDLHPALVIIDGVCIAVFTVELLVRFTICPSKVKFFKSFFNIIDIFCVIPLLIVYIIQLIKQDFWDSAEFFFVIAYLSASSVLRVLRLFKLARNYRGLRILQLAMRSSLRELILLFLLISMGMLIFSTLIYFAEFDVPSSDFPNIPFSFWWSIITMTTVGYGDLHPNNGWGYLIGGMCAVSGMLITGLPIPIIASNFNHYYNYARLIAKMAQKPQCHLKWRGIVHGLPPSRQSSVMGTSCPRILEVKESSHSEQSSLCSSDVDENLDISKSTARLSSIGVGSSDKPGHGASSPRETYITVPSANRTTMDSTSRMATLRVPNTGHVISVNEVSSPVHSGNCPEDMSVRISPRGSSDHRCRSGRRGATVDSNRNCISTNHFNGVTNHGGSPRSRDRISVKSSNATLLQIPKL